MNGGDDDCGGGMLFCTRSYEVLIGVVIKMLKNSLDILEKELLSLLHTVNPPKLTKTPATWKRKKQFLQKVMVG